MCWFRPGYSKELDALRTLVRKVAPRSLPTSDQRLAREAAFARPGVNKIWVGMALMDTFLQYAVKLRLHDLRGRTVICDRYLPDALLDFELRFPKLQVPSWKASGMLQASCPKPDVSILLMLSETEMQRRAALKAEPFPDTPEVRQQRYRRYVDLAKSGDFIVINAEDTIPHVHEQIMHHVLRAIT